MMFASRRQRAADNTFEVSQPVIRARIYVTRSSSRHTGSAACCGHINARTLNHIDRLPLQLKCVPLATHWAHAHEFLSRSPGAIFGSCEEVMSR